MTDPVSIGACIIFRNGYGDFCAGRRYAIVAQQTERWLLVEISFETPSLAKHVRSLRRTLVKELEDAGLLTIASLPDIPRSRRSMSKLNLEREHDCSDPYANERYHSLAPLIAAKEIILGDRAPERKCNELARTAGLHVTRARWQFFWLAAFNFEPLALKRAYWNSGPQRQQTDATSSSSVKRGRKPKNPAITPPGWPFDQEAWPRKIMRGWRKFSRPGRSYRTVFVLTLSHEFGCLSVKSEGRARIYNPDGQAYPTFVQFRSHVIREIGKQQWMVAKYGEQTIRNRRTSSANTVEQYLINLLEEVQWDAQIMNELPGDLRDPTQPGLPIVRVIATCGTCGGPCGVGYDYGTESKWGYLMALLCMAMKKSEFGDLFGVEISDEDWPAIGVMAAIRGDRGPAIGRPVTEIVGGVLRIWQEWAASFDSVGKAVAESGHYKTLKIEGKPERPVAYCSAMEIVRDDLRKTAAKFCSADMSHRLDPDQARRLPVGTPKTIWNDLIQRGLYAGQIVPYQKLIPLTLPCLDVSILEDGIHLGGLRYLSPELQASGLLEQARGNAIRTKIYVMNLSIKYIWTFLGDTLVRLTGSPKRANTLDVSHSLTLAEALFYQERVAESRRIAEQESAALELYNEIEREKDHKALERARRQLPEYRSEGKAATIRQHQKIFKRK